jgi:hypothetical protein
LGEGEKCSLTKRVLFVLFKKYSLTNGVLLGFSEKCSFAGFIPKCPLE